MLGADREFGNYVIAVQTDALPPEGSCTDLNCNGARNGWRTGP